MDLNFRESLLQFPAESYAGNRKGWGWGGGERTEGREDLGEESVVATVEVNERDTLTFKGCCYSA